MDPCDFLKKIGKGDLIQPWYERRSKMSANFHESQKEKVLFERDEKKRLLERKKKLINLRRKLDRNRQIRYKVKQITGDKIVMTDTIKSQFTEELNKIENEEIKDFSKFYKLSGTKRALVKKPNIDRSSWRTQILNKHKKIRMLREQVNPINRCESFVKIFQPGIKPVVEKLTHEEILQLIMHHMIVLGYDKAVDLIEEEADVKYQPKYLHDSRLHTLLRNSIKRSEKLWNLTLTDEVENDQQENNTNTNNVTNNKNQKKKSSTEQNRENMIVEHLIKLGLGQDEEEDEEEYANIWEEPNTSKYIIYTDETVKKKIKAASFNKLVEVLTDESGVDSGYLHTFLLTYLSFTTSEKLLTKLIQRFHVPRPKDLNEDQYKQKKRKVNIRVANLIKNWVVKYLTNPDKKLLQYLREFITQDIAEELPTVSHQLLAKIKNLEKRSGKEKIVKFIEKPPQPIVPKNIFSPQLSLYDVVEEEMARQLTLLDHNTYSKIRPTELLNLAWSKAKYRHRAKNVLAFIHRFNSVSNWIATEILKHDRVRKRATIVNYFINIAHNLRNINNFNSLISIVSGFNSSAIHRLKFTFQECGTRIIELKNKFEIEMSADQSYKNYRQTLHGANPPCVPYLGVYLTDLTFIEDGNPDKIDGLINFSKRRLVYAVIEEIQRYQSKPYSYQPVHQIQTRLEKLQFDDETTLYKKSLQYEPRKSRRENIK
ncbi:ras guanine nucleotide exchange factor i-related [Anaeramoeba flamelloides]|uniref:Ras guanine nucleotide exchange factor i-related n=1 Tax=Anaeramoeba flamelloides TaxID=1746091 RepID=A0AAV7ZR51_9EUKA|nr:ras guanine nucleotide exchange factor i-related [Anaeramoeba flamelloides]